MRSGEKTDIYPQGERGIGLCLPFNQAGPILLKWWRAGPLKLKAASKTLNYKLAPLVLGLWVSTLPAGNWIHFVN